MNNSIYRVSLDMHESASQIMLNIKKADISRQILVSLYDNGRLYQIDDGCTATFRAKKPDGTILYNDCDIENNVIIYQLTNQASAAVGIVECEITLYGTDQEQITTSRFALKVEDTIYSDSEIESTNQFTSLSNAINQCNNLNINLEETDDGNKITLTKKDGTTVSKTIKDGIDAIPPEFNVRYSNKKYYLDITSYDESGESSTESYELDVEPQITQTDTSDGVDVTITIKGVSTVVHLKNGQNVWHDDNLASLSYHIGFKAGKPYIDGASGQKYFCMETSTPIDTRLSTLESDYEELDGRVSDCESDISDNATNITTNTNAINSVKSSFEASIKYSTSATVVGVDDDGDLVYRQVFNVNAQGFTHGTNYKIIYSIEALAADTSYYGLRNVSNNVVVQSSAFWLIGDALTLVGNGITITMVYSKSGTSLQSDDDEEMQQDEVTYG